MTYPINRSADFGEEWGPLGGYHEHGQSDLVVHENPCDPRFF